MVMVVCDWLVKVLPVKTYWHVAQQVERLAVNQDVAGSSPAAPADVPDINVGNIQKRKMQKKIEKRS